MAPEIAAKALGASPTVTAGVPPLESRSNPAQVATVPPAPPRADLGAAWERSLKRQGAKLPN
jgi:hypothetical protein